MDRKPRVDRFPEEKWQIVQEGLKSGNVSETCRRYGIAPNLFYRWKDEAEQGAKAALYQLGDRGGCHMDRQSLWKNSELLRFSQLALTLVESIESVRF